MNLKQAAHSFGEAYQTIHRQALATAKAPPMIGPVVEPNAQKEETRA